MSEGFGFAGEDLRSVTEGLSEAALDETTGGIQITDAVTSWPLCLDQGFQFID